MKEITSKEFIDNKKDGVYVFHSSGCFTCEEHIKNMIDEFNHFFLIETSDDIEYFESINIVLTPCTILYKNDKEIWRKQGAFYNKQINELRKEMYEL